MRLTVHVSIWRCKGGRRGWRGVAPEAAAATAAGPALPCPNPAVSLPPALALPHHQVVIRPHDAPVPLPVLLPGRQQREAVRLRMQRGGVSRGRAATVPLCSTRNPARPPPSLPPTHQPPLGPRGGVDSGAEGARKVGAAAKVDNNQLPAGHLGAVEPPAERAGRAAGEGKHGRQSSGARPPAVCFGRAAAGQPPHLEASKSSDAGSTTRLSFATGLREGGRKRNTQGARNVPPPLVQAEQHRPAANSAGLRTAGWRRLRSRRRRRASPAAAPAG